MRIVLIADTFPPLRISGAVMLHDLACEFARQGHDLTVVTPAAELETPWKIERQDGFTVLRCRTPPTKDVPYVRRTLNEMRLPFVVLRALRRSGLQAGRWDGVVWYSPTIFWGPLVHALRREHGCRTYLILMDIFPEWAADVGVMGRGPVYYFFKRVEALQYAAADTIGVQAAATLPYFRRWAGRGGRKAEVLQSWLADARDTGCPLDLGKTPLAGKKIFVYTGNMGVAQGLRIFVEAAAALRDRPDVGFLFVGRGSEAEPLAAEAASRGLANFIFHPEIDPGAIPGLLAQCHVGVVALDPRLNTHNVPGKFITYIRVGLPVLAHINPGNELAALIGEQGIGRADSSGDARALAAIVREMAATSDRLVEMGARARKLFEQTFSPGASVRQIVSALSVRG